MSDTSAQICGAEALTGLLRGSALGLALWSLFRIPIRSAGGGARWSTRSIPGPSPTTTRTASATSLGMIDQLPYLAGLGVDADLGQPVVSRRRWPTAATTSRTTATSIPTSAPWPQADEFVARGARARPAGAHRPGAQPQQRQPIRGSVAALARRPGSAGARAVHLPRRLWVRTASIPPNNWPAMFGGRRLGADHRRRTARPGQWFLHLFAPEQPDWNWDNPAVADGVRRDPAVLVRPWRSTASASTWPTRWPRRPGLPGRRGRPEDRWCRSASRPDRYPVPEPAAASTTSSGAGGRVADSYADSEQGPRVFVSEAYVTPAERAGPLRPARRAAHDVQLRRAVVRVDGGLAASRHRPHPGRHGRGRRTRDLGAGQPRHRPGW